LGLAHVQDCQGPGVRQIAQYILTPLVGKNLWPIQLMVIFVGFMWFNIWFNIWFYMVEYGLYGQSKLVVFDQTNHNSLWFYMVE
jgi:hypothetical protein